MKISNFDIDNYDIIIAGGSFTGLTLAKSLAFSSNDQLKIAIIDQNSPTQQGQLLQDERAFALTIASKKMLDTFGIWEKISEKAYPIKKIEITDSQLESVTRQIFLQIDNTQNDSSPSSYILKNKYINKALIESLDQYQNINSHLSGYCRDFQS